MIFYFTGTSKNWNPTPRAHFAGAFWGYPGVLLDTTGCSHKLFDSSIHINSPQQHVSPLLSPQQRIQVAWCFPTWPTAHLWCPRRGEPQSFRPRDMDCRSQTDQMGHPPQGYHSAMDLRRQRPSRTWSTHQKTGMFRQKSSDFVGWMWLKNLSLCSRILWVIIFAQCDEQIGRFGKAFATSDLVTVNHSNRCGVTTSCSATL